MNPNLDHKQIVRGIVEARDARRFDGWLLFVEALAVGVLLFLWRDNALIALAGFVVAFGLLAQKVIGTAIVHRDWRTCGMVGRSGRIHQDWSVGCGHRCRAHHPILCLLHPSISRQCLRQGNIVQDNLNSHEQ